MEKLGIVKAVAAELESGNPQGMAIYLSEDFLYNGPVPEPLPRNQYIEFMTAIKRALPDWSYKLEGIMDTSRNVIKALVQPQGTHTGDLVLPCMPLIPASGRKVLLPHELISYTIHEGLIKRMNVETSAGGGFLGLLEQLGMRLPHVFWQTIGSWRSRLETAPPRPVNAGVLL